MTREIVRGKDGLCLKVESWTLEECIKMYIPSKEQEIEIVKQVIKDIRNEKNKSS